MGESIAEHAAALQTWVYVACLFLVGSLELARPLRRGQENLRTRWIGNFSLTLLNLALLRWLYPLLGVGFALVVAEAGVGLFSGSAIPGWIAVGSSIAALDLARYLHHRCLHRVPLFWAFHAVHHTDTELDFTTGFRFHPLEAVTTASVDLAVVAALGAPPVAVLTYASLGALIGTLAHGNLRLPARLEQRLRPLFVTPDLHRIHHSCRKDEANSNLGVVFSVWDRLLRTHRGQPFDTHAEMTLGLPAYRHARHNSLFKMLLLPLLHWADAAQRGDVPAPGDPHLFRVQCTGTNADPDGSESN